MPGYELGDITCSIGRKCPLAIYSLPAHPPPMLTLPTPKSSYINNESYCRSIKSLPYIYTGTNRHHGEFHTQPAGSPVCNNHYESTTSNTHAELANNDYYDRDAELEKECANPIYGGDEPSDLMYTTPGELNDRNQESLPAGDHEFENIIYGTEDANVYSEPTADVYDTVDDR